MTGDLLYWPPGHNVRVDADAEIVMFSPQHEHSHAIDHMIKKTKDTLIETMSLSLACQCRSGFLPSLALFPESVCSEKSRRCIRPNNA